MKSKATNASKQTSQQKQSSKNVSSSSKKQIEKKSQNLEKESNQQEKANLPASQQKDAKVKAQSSTGTNPVLPPEKNIVKPEKQSSSKIQSKKSILIDPPRRELPKSQTVTIKPYLENTFQEVINKGLKQVLAHQPADPIKYLGEFMLKHSNSN